MIISNIDSLNQSFRALHTQAKTMLENGKVVEVVVSEFKPKRTNAQNDFLWVLYKHLVDFYDNTGFVIDELDVMFLKSGFLHEYCKARFDVKSTAKLDRKAFCEYVDKIQFEMMTQSKGNYEYLIPTPDLISLGYDFERNLR